MEKFNIIEGRLIKNLKAYDFNLKDEFISNFENLWHTKRDYFKHLAKRVDREKVVKDEFDYILKTFNALFNGKTYYEMFPLNDIWDRVFYSQNDKWVVIIGEEGKILTSYQVQRTIDDTFQKHIKMFDVQIREMETSDEFKREIKKITTKLREF